MINYIHIDIVRLYCTDIAIIGIDVADDAADDVQGSGIWSKEDPVHCSL